MTIALTSGSCLHPRPESKRSRPGRLLTVGSNAAGARRRERERDVGTAGQRKLPFASFNVRDYL